MTVARTSVLSLAGVVCGLVVIARPVSAGSWNVANPPGPHANVTVDVTSGTWVDLDVSRDGRHIVFELLGDLFTMGIEGGEARALASGLPFDSQPRFSPDGAQIAFISDRSGADNVWIMNADGTGARQVTRERVRTPSVPAWSPDGRNLVVRKHYTAVRSIGAGEIWSYPADGGEGVRLVERQSTQKDLNEPHYSSDGRIVYYSRESWPGDEFLYDRDVHKGIYQILALDLRTGSIETVIAGPGGGVRPTPSPDGRFLAYVRRNGVDAAGRSSALVVREIESGIERVVRDKLDQDAQEIWENYGLYPAFAWMPDSASLVFWSGGKIHRIAQDGGGETEIPFHVKQTFDVVQPPQPRFAAAPGKFPVKAVRWATVAPQGDRVAFQALGRIYVRTLPSGVARRLTKQQGDFEFQPAFSPDGRWVVYTTWNDATFGSVRRTQISSGETVVLTRQPGHYVEPTVSPDGRSVVFHRAGSGELLNPAWSRNAGLYEVPWGGGEDRALSTDGAAPHFCRDGRLFVTRRAPHPDKPPAGEWANDDRTLLSMSEDGKDARPYAVSEFATQYGVSPDCRWLARVELGEVLVTPLAASGKPAKLTVHSNESSQFHAPGDGGDYVSWSTDGKLHWTLGPDLYSWRFGTDGPQGGVTRQSIAFDASQAIPAGSVALVHGRLITMRGGDVIDDGTVIVSGNRIRAVGKTGEVDVPAGARLIDLGGRTVIPGLIDSHWHGLQAENGMQPQQNWMNFGTLALGVTTLFDPAPDTADFFSAAELARTGAIVSPRIFGTGKFLYGPQSDRAAVIESYDDALKQVRRLKAWGATAVKSYLQPRREQRQQIVAAARELGVRVMTETSMAGIGILAQVMDGNTSIEHNIPMSNIYEDVIQLWSQTGVDNVPTFIVFMNGMSGENWWYAQSEVWRHPLASRYVPPLRMRAESVRRIRVPHDDLSAFAASKSEKRLHDAGVRVLAGAHGVREGLGLHWEMWLLAAGGMSPMETLGAATIRAAEHLGLSADLGSIEPGKLADMVVLDADPLADIHNTDKVRTVIANGLVFDAATMNAVNGASRRPFFWEAP